MNGSETENLSVKLFSQHKHANETSTLIDSVSTSMTQSSAHDSAWYRVLRRPQWSWQGLPPILIEETLSRIASSTNERSHENLLDTVYGYRLGNWAYEWIQSGMRLQRSADLTFEKENITQASEEWFIASTCFSIAGYPYIKGDALGIQADIMANKAFQKAIEHAKHRIIQITTKIDGKQIKGYLYLPNTDSTLPTVMVSGGIDCQQIELWRLFERYFAPANLAMLTLDMPGIGHSNGLHLTEDTSRVHQAMLKELRNVPWVDHDRVGCFGVRFSGNAAVRMAFVEQKSIKACVSLGGVLHTILDTLHQQTAIPPMYLDSLAVRMGKNRVDPTLLTYIKAMSLKHQGLLAGRKTPVPVLAMRLSDDPVCSDVDNQLAAMYSTGGQSITLRQQSIYEDYHELMVKTVEWFQQRL